MVAPGVVGVARVVGVVGVARVARVARVVVPVVRPRMVRPRKVRPRIGRMAAIAKRQKVTVGISPRSSLGFSVIDVANGVW